MILVAMQMILEALLMLMCVGDAAHDYGDPAHESVDASCGCGDSDHKCSALMADHDFGDTAHV